MGDDWMARYGLKDLFSEPDLITVSAKAQCAKPSTEIYEYFCKQSGLTPGECVFIDDKQPNVDAALALEWRAFKFRHISKDGKMQDTAETLVERLRANGVAI